MLEKFSTYKFKLKLAENENSQNTDILYKSLMSRENYKIFYSK
jgi:hypothetical protein